MSVMSLRRRFLSIMEKPDVDTIEACLQRNFNQ
jgi:hypothetical protein